MFHRLFVARRGSASAQPDSEKNLVFDVGWVADGIFTGTAPYEPPARRSTEPDSRLGCRLAYGFLFCSPANGPLKPIGHPP